MSDMKPLFELSEEIERKYRSKLNSDFMDERFYDEKNRYSGSVVKTQI